MNIRQVHPATTVISTVTGVAVMIAFGSNLRKPFRSRISRDTKRSKTKTIRCPRLWFNSAIVDHADRLTGSGRRASSAGLVAGTRGRFSNRVPARRECPSRTPA